MLTKTQAAKCTPKGWVFQGVLTDDLGQVFYGFQTGDYNQGFKEVHLLEEDMEEKNIAFMIEHNMSRVMGFDYSDYE